MGRLGWSRHAVSRLFAMLQAKEQLLSGEMLSEEFVAQVITEKLQSLEIQHYGELLYTTPQD